ncbi:DUF433 domain-containing protein [Inquilinus limosus]|uniref:DUF433 domain-containing protein n=1 Tax=Inquilinus limosus TaxID=171674 RepID=UPI00040FF3F7|nr:DUF433 domain-containing protein [Inquilinus limosus]
MADATDDLTVGEACVVTGLRPDQINDAIDRKRVPSRWVTAQGGRRRLDKRGLVAFKIETSLAGRVPVEIRQRWYAKLAEGASPGRLVTKDPETSVTYQVDLRPYRADIDSRWRKLKSAKRLIVEDPDIQAGAATFKGTRILVHPIADALAAGISEAELLEDYPRLTRDMLDAARIWCVAYPRRGRPRAKAPWQEASDRTKRGR